ARARWLAPEHAPAAGRSCAMTAPGASDIIPSERQANSGGRLLMDQTRIVGPGGEATQLGGYYPTPGMEPGRTVMAGAPGGIDLTVIPGNRYALATGNSRERVLCQVSASGMLAGRRLPLNLALVIDRSGSMEGEPLEYVKRACAHVVDLLEPNDILSVVTFEDRADIVMPARRVINKALIKEHINR